MSIFKKKRPKPRTKLYVIIRQEDFKTKIEIKKSERDAIVNHLICGTEKWINVRGLYILRTSLRFFSFHEEDQ